MRQLNLVLALAAVLGGASSAQALQLAADGRGQVLLFPYYTVNGGNQTLISIVNTTINGKATKLVFREGLNSRVALELSIYIAPYDVWTGAVFSVDETGAAHLVTHDNTCTLPRLKTSTSLPILPNGSRYVAFSNAAYSGSSDDAGPDHLARTREGHFELIEMGEIPNNTPRNTLAAISQGPSGTPANCLQIERAWLPGGYWQLDAATEMEAPGGGLFGSAYYVDVLNGTMQSIAADAIEDFSTKVLHAAPAQGQPTLASANAGAATQIEAHIFVDGAPLTLRYPSPEQAIDAVSAVLMAGEIHNEFVTGANIGGASEWVVAFPTKHFYTDRDAGRAIAPFTRTFSAVTTSEGVALVDFDAAGWTRSGTAAQCIEPLGGGGCFVGVPPPRPPPQLGWAVNVIGFNQLNTSPGQSLILGSPRNHALELYDPMDFSVLAEGTFRMSFWDPDSAAYLNQYQLRADANGRRLHGLPVQGFWIASYTNTAVTPGVLANYSDAVSHRARTSISGVAP